MDYPKIVKDWGVRATLATLTVLPYEILLFFLAARVSLTPEFAMALLGAGQAPAMLALGFYFGQRAGQQSTGEK